MSDVEVLTTLVASGIRLSHTAEELSEIQQLCEAIDAAQETLEQRLVEDYNRIYTSLQHCSDDRDRTELEAEMDDHAARTLQTERNYLDMDNLLRYRIAVLNGATGAEEERRSFAASGFYRDARIAYPGVVPPCGIIHWQGWPTATTAEVWHDVHLLLQERAAALTYVACHTFELGEVVQNKALLAQEAVVDDTEEMLLEADKILKWMQQTRPTDF